MYHAKKFSTVSLVPHKMQGSEPVSNAGAMGSSSVKSSPPPGGSGKQRLRWTEDLHNRFVDAITQLGGPDSGYFLFSNEISFKSIFIPQEVCILLKLITAKCFHG